jgi:proteasome lid subunit RPN8/RPN11
MDPGSIRLSPEVRALVRAEGEKAYPYEACGLLLGREIAGEGGGLRDISLALPVRNAREGEAGRRRFSIEPEDFLKAEREALSRGLDLLGIYHSHPDHGAEPSAHDLELALPYYSYVILRVADGKAEELNSFRLLPDRSAFLSEKAG